MSASNGQYHFSISASDHVKEKLRRLMFKAKVEGYGTRFRHVVRSIYDLLRVYARSLGEPLQEFPGLQLQTRHIQIESVLVEFAVHYTKPLVFIRDVEIVE